MKHWLPTACDSWIRRIPKSNLIELFYFLPIHFFLPDLGLQGGIWSCGMALLEGQDCMPSLSHT